MADFEDITGWREELAAFKKSDEGYKFFYERPMSDNKMRLSEIYELAELYFKFDCLHEALKKKAHWEEYTLDELDDMPGLYHENHERLRPAEAMDTCIDFRDWYAMKKNIRADQMIIDIALTITAAYELGQIDTIRAEDAVARLPKRYAKNIILDVGDDN